MSQVDADMENFAETARILGRSAAKFVPQMRCENGRRIVDTQIFDASGKNLGFVITPVDADISAEVKMPEKSSQEEIFAALMANANITKIVAVDGQNRIAVVIKNLTLAVIDPAKFGFDISAEKVRDVFGRKN